MQAPNIKFSEFIDLLLARLYDVDQERRIFGEFIDLNEVTKQLKEDVPLQWVWDAAKLLESRGLAKCIFAKGGYCAAMLTGEGRLYVEEERGTGIIPKYHQNPSVYVVNVSGGGNQVVVGSQVQGAVQQINQIEKEREPAFSLLKEMQKRLEDDKTLADSERKELLADIEDIRRQLRKKEPNHSVLIGLLDSLSKVTSIAGNIANFVRFLNPP